MRARRLGAAEPEVLRLAQLASRFRTAVDVGANRGEYTYQMARLFQTVWSFEPNEVISQPIRSARLPNVRLVDAALSSEEGEGVLRLPIVNGQALPGWASLDPRIGESFQQTPVRIATLDSFALSDVDFIKIDVEGFELNVLRGGARTIETCRPACLVEVDKSNIESLTEFFRERGYSAHAEWRGVTLSSQNLLFAPDEAARRVNP